MDSTVIGKNIRKYRMNKNLTQKGLADQLDVTMQAVSKWENGGIPDAMMLPRIADVLDVSIDALFGMSDDVKQDPVEMMISDLTAKEGQERFKRAFEFAWTALVNSGKEVEELRKLAMDFDTLDPTGNQEYLAQVRSNYGYGLSNITKGHKYLMMMAPESRYDVFLAQDGEYAELFRVLSDKKVLKVLRCMMQCPNGRTVPARIRKVTGIDRTALNEVLQEMKKVRLLSEMTVEGEEEPIYTYGTERTMVLLIPMLALAKNILHNDNFVVGLGDGVQPFL